MAEISVGTVAYTFGILSIVFAFVAPIGGLIIGIIGLIQSNKNKVEKARKLNVIGIILSTILFIVSVLLTIYTGVSSGTFPLA